VVKPLAGCCPSVDLNRLFSANLESLNGLTFNRAFRFGMFDRAAIPLRLRN
jgi:hypothetical protein